MPTTIQFYSQDDKETGYLSNYAPYPVFLKGVIWQTTEHYFQAQKHAFTEREEQIRRAKTPDEAKKMGRDPNYPLPKNWKILRDEVMRDALYAKFTQHPDLRQKLLATGDAILVEHTKNDSYWGDGGNGNGVSRLGQLLMEIRAVLQKQA